MSTHAEFSSFTKELDAAESEARNAPPAVQPLSIYSQARLKAEKAAKTPQTFILVRGQKDSVEFRLVGEFVRVISKGRDWLAVTLPKEKARKEYGRLLTLGYVAW